MLGFLLYTHQICRTVVYPNSYDFIVPLEGRSLEEIWKENITPRGRRAVRQAENNTSLVLKVGESTSRLHNFYQLYLVKMSSFGVKPKDFRFFNRIMQHRKSHLITVYHSNRMIAGALMFSYRDILINCFIASDPRYLKYRPNNLLYWHMIKLAKEKGYKTLSYGLSDINDNVSKFKMSMGGKPIKPNVNIVFRWVIKLIYPIIKKIR